MGLNINQRLLHHFGNSPSGVAESASARQGTCRFHIRLKFAYSRAREGDTNTSSPQGAPIATAAPRTVARQRGTDARQNQQTNDCRGGVACSTLPGPTALGRIG